jgi:signal transduction histidine kinase
VLGRLAAHDGVPVLVVRLPDIERIAWQRGRASARRLEARALRAFTETARRVLRVDDVLAHERGTDIFAAALCGSPRGADHAGSEPDPRAALARIGAALEIALSRSVQVGWTRFRTQDDDAGVLFARALEQGARERERYAFFSLLGHEVRTPLASICGYLETLLDGSIPADVRDRFTRIAYRESLRLGRLVTGLFEISLFDGHAHDARSAAAYVGLADAFDAAGDATSAVARAAHADVAFESSCRAEVAIDADRLVLVLVNLIENAIVHGRRPATVRVSATIRAADVAITIDDDGPGVVPADRERIFALGARGASSASGSGIGLALVRLLVTRAGGRVTVGSSPLGGARFMVILPQHTSAIATPRSQLRVSLG